jgi:hypothetical protein
MDTGTSYRPRVSRETRLLLLAGAIAVAALWVLARVRFDERPASANPVASVLGQLNSGQKFEDLAGEIGRLHARLEGTLLSLDVTSGVDGRSKPPRMAAIRLRDDLAVTWLAPGASDTPVRGAAVVARDAASGVTVVRIAGSASIAPPPPPSLWAPRQLQRPRYFRATEVSPAGIGLRPAFVGSLDPVASPLWAEPVWILADGADLTAGSFLFTDVAELAGLVIPYGGGLAIIPGNTVVAEAERLIATPPGNPGSVGVDVQDLTDVVAAATGASAGVVVTWVAPTGPAAKKLAVGDVIESVDGQPLVSRAQWRVRVARLAAGQAVALRVRHRGENREVTLTAAPTTTPPQSRALGLTLRSRAGAGAEVLRIDPGSAAARAELRAGDLITLAGDIEAPSASQVARSFARMKTGERLLVALREATRTS